MARREYKGAAVQTRLSTGIGSGDTSFDIVSSTGWATGGANGPFTVILDPGQSTEEHVLVGSRSTLTLSSVTRGYDDTVPVAHSAGADGTVIMGSTAVDFNEANRHINDTTIDEHTQYMRANGTRHDLTARHSAGSVVPTAAPNTIVPNAVAAEGGGTTLARSTHTHGIATATAVTSGLANAEGTGNNFARATHTHDQAAASIDTAELVDLAVTSGKLGTASVIAGKIAAGGVSATNQIVDAIVTLAKMASEASTTYVPASFATSTFNLGTGGTKYGNYFKIGRIVVGWAGFAMAADGNLLGTVIVPLPIAMRTTSDGQRGFAAGRCQGGGLVFSGTGVVLSGASQVNNLATAGASAVWDETNPFNWGTAGVGASNLDVVFFYEAAT